MSEQQEWERILGSLNDEQRRVVRRFVLRSIRSQAVAPLWVYGPAESGRSALVKAIATALGSIVEINGFDLERGRFALWPLYDHVSGKTIASVLIVHAGNLSRRFRKLLDVFEGLVLRGAVTVFAKSSDPLEWCCDLPIVFVSDVPPPDGLVGHVVGLELTGSAARYLSTKLNDATLARTIRRWAVTSWSLR